MRVTRQWPDRGEARLLGHGTKLTASSQKVRHSDSFFRKWELVKFRILSDPSLILFIKYFTRG